MNKKGLITALIGILLNISSFILTIKEVEPIHTHAYIFLWWSFIVFISGVSYTLKKVNFTFFNPKKFIQLCMISSFIWLISELLNLRVKNWCYYDVPSNHIFLGFLGYFSFATVLPGMFIVSDILDSVLQIKEKEIKLTKKMMISFFIFGLLTLLLMLIFPRYFFPFMWVSLFFIFEPLNHFFHHRCGVLSEANRIIPLLISGFICGVLWELWNYFSGAHWIYTIPLPTSLGSKIFQMPILGYIGFPPFVVQSFSIYKFIVASLEKIKRKYLIILVYLIYCVISFHLIIKYTVKTFR